MQELVASFEVSLREQGRSLKTLEAYRLAVVRVASTLGDPEIGGVTPIDLAEWRWEQALTARPATVNVEIDALRQFFRWAAA